MKIGAIILLLLMFFVFSITSAFAEHHTAEDRGKAHFNNATFAGGKKSCSTCHPGGKRLEDAGTKTTFMGAKQATLEEAINICVVNANKGKALDVNSTEMQELAHYIKSIGAAAPGYGK